ncbi:hypothetical protein [Tetragenococcus halophilus]|uniref:hypothetical protein n=1 Tax=Tetragenococcus halophilus TaxID=51669 RepID=UPI0012EA2FDC|nr:hypothetical protein [Tetragenococcus halophilus]
MDRQEAIQKAARLANEYIKNRNDAERKHKELNQLFKQFHLSWDEINEEDKHNAKK